VYINSNSIEDELLFCKPLKNRTTGEDIFNLVDSNLKEEGLSWDEWIDICSDGAKSMTGKHCGFIARVKGILPEIGSSHYIIHRHALAVKKIPLNLQNVLGEVVKIVNLLKSRPMNSRIFTALCEETGSQFTMMLLHTEVR
jgi:hypothetical protein